MTQIGKMAWIRQNGALSLALSLTLFMIAHASDICEQCKCSPNEDNNLVIYCKGYKNHKLDIDFELIDWPKSDENSYIAFFNNLSIHLLPKMAGDQKIISLNLDDNTIRTVQSDPFELFTNLESISLANNLISDLTKDFFKFQSKLKEINIANNSLASIDHQIFTALVNLEELNLSQNFLTKLTADFLEATSSVKTLRVENNKIYAIDMAYDKVDYELRQLFLAYNHFTVITSSMFEKLTKLEVIDLSNNAIANIDENTFNSLSKLKLLDLSSNFLKRVAIRLPDSIELLSMNSNNLITWPLLNTPDNLMELELQQNNLEYIFPKDQEVKNLRVLDVSKNIITLLPNTQFLQLEKLDLSYNLMSTIPKNLNYVAPLLSQLVLDGTQIETIEFEEKTILQSISLSHLPLLKKIQSGAFINLAGSQLTQDGSESCIDLKISHNELLSEIDEAAFDGFGRMCHLDLSYNNLTKVPQNLTDWTKLEYGVDFQGNPLSCHCEDEWILESILNTLYYNEQLQDNLLELRCQSPDEIANRRLVSFLNHKNPFCKNFSDEEQMQKMVQKSNFGGFYLDSTPPNSSGKSIDFHLAPFSVGFIIIVALSALILVLMILVGVRWQREQNRKLARRNRLYYDYNY